MNSLKSKRLPTVNIECRKSKLNNRGEAPLFIRVTINRKSSYISLKKYVNPDYFNSKKQKMKSGDRNKIKTNSYIQSEKEKIENIIFDLHRGDNAITFNLIKEVYLKGEFSEFISFVLAEIEEERKLNLITKNSLLSNVTFVRTLKEFVKEIRISDINEKFILQFKSFLVNIKKYKPHTVQNKLKQFRKYIRIAYRKKLIDTDRFDALKVKEIDTDKDYITFEELESLHQAFINKRFLKSDSNNETKETSKLQIEQHQSLQHFLIACYTGLRHSDVENLRKHHFVNDMIQINIKKTKKTIYIPVRQRLKEIIEIKPDSNLVCSPVLRNNKTNIRMRTVLKSMGIDKKITFHSARHSFAILSLLLGIPLEVISDILGHFNMNITKHFYAKIVNDMRNKHMDKWDNIVTENKPKPPSSRKVINMIDYEKQQLQNEIDDLKEQIRLQAMHLKANNS